LETGVAAAGVVVTNVAASGAIDKPEMEGFSGKTEMCAVMPAVIEAMRRATVGQLPTSGCRTTAQVVQGVQLGTPPWSMLGALSSWIACSFAHADARDAGQRCVLVLMAHGPHDKITMTSGDALHRVHAAASTIATIVRGFGTPEIAWVTPREQEVLELLVLGFSVREIGEKLGRSPHTVHDYVKSMHRKLNASNRGALVARALGHHRFANVEVRPMQA
jgi:DNA-binding CsgD family transcriptional regulator